MSKKEGTRFYSCRCFTTDNIFLDQYKIHVSFVSEQQFRRDYAAILKGRGCVTEQQVQDVLNQISQEVGRRGQLTVTSSARAAFIKANYEPLHPHIYRLQESYLDPQFKRVVDYCGSAGANVEALSQQLEKLAAPRVYRIPVFTKIFCEELLEELEHFEQSSCPKGRPNTMNNYGTLLNELGFDDNFITPLREQYLQPLAALLYPDCGGRFLDSHKAFVVKYDMEEDVDLSYHYDNAEVTLNVSLGREFTEGNLYFGDMRQVPLSHTECCEVAHRATEGLLHRGQHMHGALPISSGQRWNLIIWMRSSQLRNQLCPMCDRKPALVEGEGFADGFIGESGSQPDSYCALT